MTIEEAKEIMPDINWIFKNICHTCSNIDECANCKLHKKASRIGYDNIIECFAKTDGNMKKVLRYIRKDGKAR
jgi:hypothetical protein